MYFYMILDVYLWIKLNTFHSTGTSAATASQAALQLNFSGDAKALQSKHFGSSAAREAKRLGLECELNRTAPNMRAVLWRHSPCNQESLVPLQWEESGQEICSTL